MGNYQSWVVRLMVWFIFGPKWRLLLLAFAAVIAVLLTSCGLPGDDGGNATCLYSDDEDCPTAPVAPEPSDLPPGSVLPPSSTPDTPEPPTPTSFPSGMPRADYTGRGVVGRIELRAVEENGRVIGQLGIDAIVPIYLPILEVDVRGETVEGGWCVMHPEGALYLACNSLEPLGDDMLPAHEATVLGQHATDCEIDTYYNPSLTRPRANVCDGQPVRVYAERLNTQDVRACAILPATRHPTEGEWLACAALVYP